MGCEGRNNFYVNKIFMANNKFNNRLEHQQRHSGWNPIHSLGFSMQLFNFKRVNKMAQIKLLWVLADMLGISSVILGIIDNFDSVRSVILFILALSYLGFRIYFFVIKSKQAVRKSDLELWHQEQDKIERQEKRNKNKPT